MPTTLKLLILEDRQSDAQLILDALEEGDIVPDYICVQTEVDYLAQLANSFDAILSDFAMPQFDALRALHLLKERNLDIPFLVVTGTISEETAVECIKQGAADYLLKDRLGRLPQAVFKAIEAKRLHDE